MPEQPIHSTLDAMESLPTSTDFSALPPLPPSPTLTPANSPTLPPSTPAGAGDGYGHNDHDDSFQEGAATLRSPSPSLPTHTLPPSLSTSHDDDPLPDSASSDSPPIATAAEPLALAQASAHADRQLSSHLSLLRTELATRQASLASEESEFAHTLASSPAAVQSIVDTILTLDDLATGDGPELEKHFHTPGFCLVPSGSHRFYFLPMFTAASVPGDSLWTRAKSVAANCVTLGLVTLGMVVEFILPGVQGKEYYLALKMANVGRRLRSERADVKRAEDVVRIGEVVLAHK